MSNGPIKREREAWTPALTSTTDAKRVCKKDPQRGGYCGRRSAKEKTDFWSEVTCADCKAAARADGVRIPTRGSAR